MSDERRNIYLEMKRKNFEEARDRADKAKEEAFKLLDGLSFDLSMKLKRAIDDVYTEAALKGIARMALEFAIQK